MKVVCLLTLLAFVSSSPRIKRQVDGGFWWENFDGATDTSPDLPISETVKGTDPKPVDATDRHESSTGTNGVPHDTSGDHGDVTSTGNNNEAPIDAPVKGGSNDGVPKGAPTDGSAQPSYEPCSGQNRVCVPWNLCKNGTIITDGQGILTLRSGVSLSQHSECPLVLEVCCQEPDDYDYDYTDPAPTEPLSLSKCGQRNYDGIGVRVERLTDAQSQYAEFPWMTAILRIERLPNEDVKLYLCGGSLVASNMILTAAHCVDTFLSKDLLVRVGEWDTQQTNEEYPHQEMTVKEAIVHPDFNPASLFNDVALLILDNPVKATPNVQTVCLPEPTDTFDLKTCFSTGWGKEQFGVKGTYQNILKKVDLDIVPHQPCENSLKGTRLGNYFNLHHSFICAGGVAGKDTCRGDGGSPLVCKLSKDNKHIDGYYQAGIVAWGIGCGEDGVPGVYANIPSTVDWIKAQMTPHQL